MRQLIFDISIHCTGRLLLARDLALGRVKLNWGIEPSKLGATRLAIRSGKNLLDAVLVKPVSQPARASVLICHGIGETVQHWFAVQEMLAATGVASLVFDYSGYGRSSGVFHARQSERDSAAAFLYLQREIAPLPVSLLGFSLGSGIATALLPTVPANALLLCASFTSLRQAARSVGVPGFLGGTVPPIWRAEDVLRSCKVPVLIVHGEKDRLFPVAMATRSSEHCGAGSQVIIVPNLAHNEPFLYRPRISYWGPISSYLLSMAEAAGAESI